MYYIVYSKAPLTYMIISSKKWHKLYDITLIEGKAKAHTACDMLHTCSITWERPHEYLCIHIIYMYVTYYMSIYVYQF